MPALPADIEAALVRALGTFVRTQRADLLPPTLKRLRGFRPQALTPHRAELMRVLEDDVQRRHIMQWLDSKPPLKAGEAELLRIGAERAGGWEAALEARSTVSRRHVAQAPADPSARIEAELGRERAKAKELRAELRRAKEDGRRALEAERARTAELGKRVGDLEKQLERAHSDAARHSAAAADALEQLSRTERRTSRAMAKSTKETEATKTELRAAKRQSRVLEARVAELERTEPPARRTRSAPATKRPVRKGRSPLRVPKGLFEDDPATLAEWLGAPDVHLLVDGYNVTLAQGGFGAVALENQRDRLRQEITKLATKRKARATIVFDGDLVAPGTAKLGRGRVRVEYSRPEETADDHLIERLRALPAGPVIVATNDRELQARAAELGATIATSTQLLALIR